MRSIWTGSLAFGLINIPIRVYPASEEHTLEFHMLHSKDLSPVRYARICKEDGKEIPYSDIVKGFQYAKGEYIVIDEQDFKLANAKKTSTIEIHHFTNIEEVDPIYFDKPYFLEPDKRAAKAYRLLCLALSESKMVAVASFVFRNRQRLGLVIASGDTLVLIQMRYHSEIRSTASLDLPKEKVTEKELTMALGFIKQQTKPFEAEKYHDTYVEELMDLIEKKLQGKKTPRKTVKSAPSYHARDLMSLLQASMEKKEKPKKKKYPSMPPSSRRRMRKHAP